MKTAFQSSFYKMPGMQLQPVNSRKWFHPGYPAMLSIAMILFFTGCSTKFSKLEYLNDYENLALYKLEAKNYPSDKKLKAQMAPMKEFPSLKPEQIINLLGNFEYKRDTNWGRVHRRVFYRDELEYMAPFVSQQLNELGDKYRLVIVSRFDPDRSVLSRMERVSLMMWLDEEGFNLVFGEIRTEIPNNDFLVDDEWKNIYPVSLKRAYYDLALVKDEFFEKKIINGKAHETWAQIPEQKLETLNYIPPEELKASFDIKPDLSAKLKNLQKAKDEGLITEEEFQAKRKQIMDSY